MSFAASTTGAPTTSDQSSAVSTTTLPTDTSGDHHVAETQQSRALAEKLVPSIDGYNIQPNSIGDTGPSDLQKAIDDGPDMTSARKELTDDHFVVGYQRMFAAPSQTRFIILFVYQFGDAAGAKDYTATLNAASLIPDGDVTPKRDAAPGIPGATGIESTSDGLTTHAVLFSKGRYSVMIATNDGHGDTASPTVLDIAKQQYGLL